MIHNNIELKVLIKGRSISEYRHHGQTFIEGRAGSEYEIEVRNNHTVRMEVVLSVDGLSVIDGKPAGQTSSGYLIDALSSIRIPGWKVDANTTARFTFSGNDKSYTQESGGDASNNGVIGLMAFVEKPKIISTYRPSINISASASNYNTRGYSSGIYDGSSVKSYNSLREAPRGIACSASMGGTVETMNSVLQNTWNPLGQTGAIGPAGPTGMPTNDLLLNEASVCAPQVNYLGTAFGEAAEFNTREVEFNRGDMLSYQVLYYDDMRGLRARGIIIERRSRKKAEPNAFPAMQSSGCVPPKNWRR